MAPVRKGEQVTARGHRVGPRAQTLFLMLLDSSVSVSPLLISMLVGVPAAQDGSTRTPGVCSSQHHK